MGGVRRAAQSIYLGFDPREASAFAVARQSIERHLTAQVPIFGLVLSRLREQGLYYRPTEKRLGKLYDVISQHTMATEFANSRFLVPHLAKTGWAMFADCDVLVRANVSHLLDKLDPRYALYCVKHQYTPSSDTKMDGQEQSQYARKNWSSVMVFNCDHEANEALTVELINTVPGRDLHRFCWLDDGLIGALPAEWNWLVRDEPEPHDPKLVHYTNGGPWFAGFENEPYADEWRGYLHAWAA